MTVRWMLPLVLLSSVSVSAADYDPLRIAGTGETPTAMLTVKDARRDRELPVKVYLPVAKSPAPVVLFSHGLGGNREGSAFLGKHWSARGYVAVFLQHPGSDDSVWRDVPVAGRLAALREAANLKNTVLRFEDVPAVLDQLEKWNGESGHILQGRLDLSRVGMSGHSFGAVTTQGVSGQSALLGGQKFLEPRIKAAVIMSPSVPQVGAAERAFGGVKIPWLLMTGTQDSAPIGGQTIESRRGVYPALPVGDKFELVLHNAEHSAFTDRALPGDRQARNPNHHRAILALSTAFWDAYVQGNADAQAWLQGAGPRSVLAAEDIWQAK